jgi:hypothetical protein
LNLTSSLKICKVVPESRIAELRNGYSRFEVRNEAATDES